MPTSKQRDPSYVEHHTPRGYLHLMTRHSTHPEAHTRPAHKDPVCGMDVEPATSEHTSVRDGETLGLLHDPVSGSTALFHRQWAREMGPVLREM